MTTYDTGLIPGLVRCRAKETFMAMYWDGTHSSSDLLGQWAGCWTGHEKHDDRLHLLKGMYEFSGYMRKGDVLVRSSKGRLLCMTPDQFHEFLEVYEIPKVGQPARRKDD